jgi:ribosomal-protein-alanine N-acetyltransferase
MTAAVRRICREAFAVWDILRIQAEVFAPNAGSRRVLEKAGFTLEGTKRRGVYKNGQVLDACVYALLKEELT